MIFPVTPQKIGVAGGRLIYDPEREDGADNVPIRPERKFHIVTTRIDDSAKTKLEGYGYAVHLVGEVEDQEQVDCQR